MGTRGVIARITPNGFRGRYHHWDSYPSGLGESLWKLYHGHFKGDLRAMLKVLIDEHPAGWSTICGKDFSLQAGYVESITDRTKEIDKDKQRPLCYCHGDRKEKGWEVTEKNASGSGCEWAYVFNEETSEMLILASYCNYSDKMKGVKMVGFFGCGDETAIWKLTKKVKLNGKEPNWKRIETQGEKRIEV